MTNCRQICGSVPSGGGGGAGQVIRGAGEQKSTKFLDEASDFQKPDQYFSRAGLIKSSILQYYNYDAGIANYYYYIVCCCILHINRSGLNHTQ